MLLLWILAALADSAAVVYQRYVRSLTRDEREALWQDYRVVGRQFGLRDERHARRHRRTSSPTWPTWSRATTCT